MADATQNEKESTFSPVLGRGQMGVTQMLLLDRPPSPPAPVPQSGVRAEAATERSDRL